MCFHHLRRDRQPVLLAFRQHLVFHGALAPVLVSSGKLPIHTHGESAQTQQRIRGAVQTVKIIQRDSDHIPSGDIAQDFLLGTVPQIVHPEVFPYLVAPILIRGHRVDRRLRTSRRRTFLRCFVEPPAFHALLRRPALAALVVHTKNGRCFRCTADKAVCKCRLFHGTFPFNTRSMVFKC